MKSSLFTLLIIVPIGMVVMIMSTNGVYTELANVFPSINDNEAKLISGNTLSLSKQLDHQSSLSIRDTMSFSLSGNNMHIRASFPLSLAYPDITIPKNEVYGCSKSCFSKSNWDAIVLIPKTKHQLSFENVEEILDWCWDQKIPIISSNDRRAWLYKGTSLPKRETLTSQLTSRAEYARRTQRSCAGY